MSAPFDPYHIYLGIPLDEQPPHHYRLLGLQAFETDSTAIEQAADQRMLHLRTFQPGKFGALLQRLLNEVAAARVCLLSPQRKAAYDQLLQKQLGQDAAGRTWPPTPGAGDNSAFDFLLDDDYPRSSASSSRTGNRVVQPTMIAGLFVMAVVAGLLVWGGTSWLRKPTGIEKALAVQQASVKAKEPEDPPRVTPPKTPPAIAQPATSPHRPRLQQTEPVSMPAPAARKPPPEDDPHKRTALKAAFTAALSALANRDLRAAREQIEQATGAAQSSEDRHDLDRMQNLAHCVGEFWRLMSERVSHLLEADEIEVGDTRVIVVEASKNQLTIRTAGQVRRYTLQTMPTPLVTALADASLAKDAQTKTIFAAFLLVDPQGSRERAGQLLTEAAAAGVNREALLPDLEKLGWKALSNDFQASADAIQPAAKMLDDPAKLKQAELLVKQRFHSEYRAATTAPRKAALAGLFLNTKPQAEDSAEVQSALLRQALKLATAAGRIDLVLTVADRQAQLHSLDALTTKVATVEDLVKAGGSLNPALQRDLAMSAVRLADQAAAEQRAAEMARLARVATRAAQKANNATLLKQARELAEQAAHLAQTSAEQPKAK